MQHILVRYGKREGIPQKIRNKVGSEVRKLLPYLKAYRKECVLAPLFKMLEACFDLLVPLVVAAVIDTGIANNDTGYIIRMCGILIVLALVGLFMQHYGAVFCREGGRRLFRPAAQRAFCAHPVSFVY